MAFWIPLTKSTKELGALWGIPGTHKLDIQQTFRKENTKTLKCTFQGKAPTWDLSNKVYFEVEPGDLLVFSGNLIHGSDNTSVDPKTIDDLRIALTYHLGPTKNWDPLIWLELSSENLLSL